MSRWHRDDLGAYGWDATTAHYSIIREGTRWVVTRLDAHHDPHRYHVGTYATLRSAQAGAENDDYRTITRTLTTGETTR